MPTLAAVSNRSSVVGLLDRCVQRSVALCQAGAYLHWCALALSLIVSSPLPLPDVLPEVHEAC